MDAGEEWRKAEWQRLTFEEADLFVGLIQTFEECRAARGRQLAINGAADAQAIKNMKRFEGMGRANWLRFHQRELKIFDARVTNAMTVRDLSRTDLNNYGQLDSCHALSCLLPLAIADMTCLVHDTGSCGFNRVFRAPRFG